MTEQLKDEKRIPIPMHSTSSIDSSERSKLSKSIVIGPQIQNKPAQPAHPQRAVHQINLSAIRHNYHIISAAANRQKCSVIVVVKADGYGHGAIETALHLADYCGADSFAVATVNEGIDLRKALQASPGIVMKDWSVSGGSKTPGLSTGLFQPPVSIDVKLGSDTSSIKSSTLTAGTQQVRNPMPVLGNVNQKFNRSAHIRILVLGPPTNLPDDFSLYQQYNLELMISGPQMARSLMEWVADHDSRRIAEVEKAAIEQKSVLLEQKDERNTPADGLKQFSQAVTLSHMEGVELGKELRAILIAKEKAKMNSIANKSTDSSTSGVAPASQTLTTLVKNDKSGLHTKSPTPPPPVPTVVPFKGIEEAAKQSRARELAAAKLLAHATGENDDSIDEHENDLIDVKHSNLKALSASFHDEDKEIVSTVSSSAVAKASASVSSSITLKKGVVPHIARRKLRWHALIDSGMGRLGFKSVEDDYEDDENDHENLRAPLPGPLEEHGKKMLTKWKEGPHKDAVSIIKDMSDAEIYGGAPIEFYGLCTHMAEASSDSDYTNLQMNRFKSLLKRVRQAGIAVPTISTDNSAALLTSSLNHFNPDELLVQRNVNSRGYVRTGGGIFGQRPAFKQLKAVSTLSAAVRHVAILEKGQSVGYDRAYIADRHVRIATLTVGFADGYPREFGNGKGKVCIRGSLFPIVGNVCMDMLMIELGSADEEDSIGSKISVGDKAILWGPENEDDGVGKISLADMAKSLGTTQSALTCGLNKSRVQRVYV